MPNRLFLFKIFELTFSIGWDFIDNLIPMVYQYFIHYFFQLFLVSWRSTLWTASRQKSSNICLFNWESVAMMQKCKFWQNLTWNREKEARTVHNCTQSTINYSLLSQWDKSMTSVDHVQQSFVFIFTLNVIITLLGRESDQGSSERFYLITN